MQVAGYKTQDCNVAAISDSVWYLWFCVALSSVAENMRIKHIWLTYFWAFPEDFNTYNSGKWEVRLWNMSEFPFELCMITLLAGDI